MKTLCLAIILAVTLEGPAIYDFKVPGLDGNEIDFSAYKGKKIMIVNTASKCGNTPQYAELEKLYEKYKGKLVIVGFPANNFGEQEPGSNTEIKVFCKKNYGVTFPLVKKSVVINSPQQHEVFKWLTDPARNGWNDKPPVWNFTKYLVNEEGILTHYFGPSVSPIGDEVEEAVGGK